MSAIFNLLDRIDDPAYGLDASDAGDLSIRPGAIVRVLNSPAACPLFVRVKRVLCNDTLRVEDLTTPAVTWKVGVDEVALGLTPESANIGGMG